MLLRNSPSVIIYNSQYLARLLTQFHAIPGSLPILGEQAKALIKIIRECATNAIRHANATKLFVNISDNKIEISDNGKFTNQTFIENTGIKGMRLNAETLGGELIISKDIGFKVVIKMQR